MKVCAKCFDDRALRAWITGHDEEKGCDFCGRRDSPTVDFDALTLYVRECLEKVWGYAIEQLPYESAGGGYLGKTWTTYEILYEHVGLGLPRDKNGTLKWELAQSVTEEPWCDYDWLSLDEDEALSLSWDRFCDIVKHERRFFFGDIQSDPRDHGDRSPSELLKSLASMCDSLGLVRSLDVGTSIFRARSSGHRHLETAEDLGPPPKELALLSNRMSPPGIPMMYVSETRNAAIAEIGAKRAYVGRFELLRDAVILDLGDLPAVPDIFEGEDRYQRLALSFLHDFREKISQPIIRDDRTHIDYIPTQVVTEFFRFRGIDEVHLDGIRYPSAMIQQGRNIVLFATQSDVEGTSSQKNSDTGAPPLLKLVAARIATRSA